MAALQLGIAAAAAVEEQLAFFRWLGPEEIGGSLVKRQAGYHPEFGGCDMGTTCEEACGSGFEECQSSTSLALFCFNRGRGQSCCLDDFGSKLPFYPCEKSVPRS
jgi:hypothetical protein